MRAISEIPALHGALFGALVLAGLASMQAMGAEATSGSGPVVRESALVRRQSAPDAQALAVHASMQRAPASPSALNALSARLAPKSIAAACDAGDLIFANGFE